MKKVVYFLVLLVLASCRFPEYDMVDLFLPESADIAGGTFHVLSQSVRDLSGGLPADCYLPDGTAVVDYEEGAEGAQAPMRTTSVSGTAAVQALTEKTQHNKVLELVCTYQSSDLYGNPITLSGKMILPADKKVKRYMLVSHYTVGSNAEVPSNCFSLEGVLAQLSYGLILPDYLGYGVTGDSIHPYLCMDQTSINVVDMFLQAMAYLKRAGITPEYEDIYLMGYSQGGANTMAVLRHLEENYPDIRIRRAFAGGGPYDVLATYDQFIETGIAGYPVAVPLVMQGMIVGNNLNVKMEDLMQPWLYRQLDHWINSKDYTTSQINSFINTYKTADLLSEKGMDRTSREVAELYKAMTVNSIISYAWTPRTAIYMMHSMDDEVVPFVNAMQAKSTWVDANIQYNFGHYGSHVKTCLRFISTVQSILKEEEK